MEKSADSHSDYVMNGTKGEETAMEDPGQSQSPTVRHASPSVRSHDGTDDRPAHTSEQTLSTQDQAFEDRCSEDGGSSHDERQPDQDSQLKEAEEISPQSPASTATMAAPTDCEQEPSDFLTLYTKGKEYEKLEQLEMALQCYVSAVDQVSTDLSATFQEVPDCLHRISHIYSLAEEYDKAVKFAEAEKLYYETALLGSVASRENGGNAEGKDISDDQVLINRADEFERLSKLCLDDKKPRLALDYCGKASKLRQRVYGEEDARTVRTLDMFAGIYAEVGRKQYADAMLKASNPDAPRTAEASQQDRSATGADSTGGSHGDATTQPRRIAKSTANTGSDSLSAVSDHLPEHRGDSQSSELGGDGERCGGTPTSSDAEADMTLRRRHTPVGESDHGTDAKQQRNTSSSSATRGKYAMEELAVRRERVDSKGEDGMGRASEPVSAMTLLLFLVISSIVTVYIGTLWCSWAQTRSCTAVGSFLHNFHHHMDHIQRKLLLYLR